MNTSLACWHCGEPLPATDAPQARVGGAQHAVCCHGCRAAAEWIDQLGLSDYYRLRSSPAIRAVDVAESARDTAAWSRPELARHVVRKLDTGRCEAIMLVDG
ncbi:MAG: heavy metal translocating P-type ATPase metal-binding domain-containing protein, partial [Dokdonella sp.]